MSRLDSNLVSVILPSFNHQSFLQERLDSIFNQTFANYEVILLDDASTDGSQEILLRYKNHPKVAHLILNKENSGSPFKQWEKGITLAKGKYIWIAESDDYCDINFLKMVSQQFNSNHGVIYSQSLDVNDNGTPLENRINYTRNFVPNIWESDFSLNGPLFIKDYLVYKNVIPNASAVVFRKDLIRLDTFDDVLRNLTMVGDWLFWIKILRDTDIYFISDPLNFFRTHDQTSRQHDSIDKKRKRLLEEREILDFLIADGRLVSDDLINNLYHRWFKLHSKHDILKKGFYKICLKDSRLKLFNKFISSKLSKR